LNFELWDNANDDYDDADVQVARVYIGSFWDQPLHYDVNRRLFELEEKDLFADIQSLPRNAILRKLNDLIKRARLAKVRCMLVHESIVFSTIEKLMSNLVYKYFFLDQEQII